MLRIFLIIGQSMFGHGVHQLLSAQPELSIVGWEPDLAAGVLRVRDLQPDVVIVENSAGIDVLQAFKQVLGERQRLRVIESNLDSNILYIHFCEKRTVEQVPDLVDIITLH